MADEIEGSAVAPATAETTAKPASESAATLPISRETMMKRQAAARSLMNENSNAASPEITARPKPNSAEQADAGQQSPPASPDPKSQNHNQDIQAETPPADNDPDDETETEQLDDETPESESGSGRKISGEQKRINKLTAQKHELAEKYEAQVARTLELEEKLKSSIKEPAPAPQGPPSAQESFMSEPERKHVQLAQQAEDAESIIDRVRGYNANDPDKAIAELASLGIENVNDVDAWITQAERKVQKDLMKFLPLREQALANAGQRQTQKKQEFEALTRKEMPWTEVKSDPRYAQVEQVLRSQPWLKDIPGGRYGAALMVMGSMALHASRNGTAPSPKDNAPSAIPKARTPRAPARQPAVGGDGSQELARAEEAYAESRTRENLKRLQQARSKAAAAV
jgi:hypothetical protein